MGSPVKKKDVLCICEKQFCNKADVFFHIIFPKQLFINNSKCYHILHYDTRLLKFLWEEQVGIYNRCLRKFYWKRCEKQYSWSWKASIHSLDMQCFYIFFWYRTNTQDCIRELVQRYNWRFGEIFATYLLAMESFPNFSELNLTNSVITSLRSA